MAPHGLETSLAIIPGWFRFYKAIPISFGRTNLFYDVTNATSLQVYLGSEGALDVEGKELPRLVYVSREKRPGYQHHKKAGAMNALVSDLEVNWWTKWKYAVLIN